MIITVYLILFILLAFAIRKFPVAMFMIGLTLYFNIGEYIDKNAFGFPNFFTFHDFGLVLAFIAGISIGNFQLNKKFKEIIIIFLLFSFYQIFVAIIINLDLLNNLSRIFWEIAVHKWRIFSIYICIPAYFVIQKNSKTVYNYIIGISFIVLSIFFISLFTPLKLIELHTLARGYVFGAERIWFENWGFIQMTIIMSLIVVLLKMKIENKLFLFSSCLAILLATLLTMTRGTIIHTVGGILLTFYILNKMFNIKYTKLILYSIVFSSVIVISMSLLFPQYLILIYETFNLTFLEMTGKVRAGTTQSRSEFELVVLFPLYLENIFFGTGFLREYFDAYGTEHELGLADLAIIGNFALYGTVGMVIYLARYLKIHKEIKKIMSKLKNVVYDDIDKYDLLFLIWAIVFFYALILFTFHNFTVDLVYNAVLFGLMVGFLFGINEKLKNKKVM